ncbi:hypothetical protein ACFOSC_00160 [Streptantibioticus rubrisoli]|uniref:Uncharacterized protein n=1 Tax=Streptantibioticus rubrisoli TaxID=1387313 RepID=A0ABT1PJU4_9ACTN|nr:hypothetical protein [Streptantibioticus rubrisoli]MCQ4045641.1 hypothetical protein [Streptantibioticus rubrisoli]
MAVIVSLFGPPVLGLCAGAVRIKKLTDLPEPLPGWTLHVGPNYIMTTAAAGPREFTWDRIKNVTIRDFRTGGPYQYTVLFLELAPDFAPSSLASAGWPHPKV